jgi:tetratricopeptide (TPR) repeat protein
MAPWRWLRDWRDERSALKELRERQRQDEAELIADELNPLHLAKLALERGEAATAASRWEAARARLPNFIYKSDDSLPLLLGLKKYDEAEALMLEGQRRFPRDRRWLAGLARISEHRGDYPEAVRRWKAVQQSRPAGVEAWVREGACLRALGRPVEAEAAFDRALRRDPTEMGAWMERAKASDDRRDWPESEARWRALTVSFRIPPVFAAHARVLIELGRIDEAEAILKEASGIFSADLDIAVTRSHLAERRGDLTAACERWTEVQRIAPYFEPGYIGRAHCLFDAGRHDEADAVMRYAIDRFPDATWPLREFANFAHRRQDWDEAADRWDAFRLRFPDSGETPVPGGDASNAAGGRQDAAASR